jgi:hypothetical protein
MGELPADVGVDHETTASALLVLATTSRGALGAPLDDDEGVADSTFEGTEVPSSLCASTLKLYFVPLVSPLTT